MASQFRDKSIIIDKANKYSRYLLFALIANVVAMLIIDFFLVFYTACSCFSLLGAFVMYIGTVGVNIAMLVLYGGLY